MEVKTYFDKDTATFTHLVWDTSSRQAAIIDPVLDFNYRSGRTATHSADAVISDLKQRDLSLKYILETHAHADHLSAAPHFKEQCGGQTGIGANVPAVQEVFKGVFNMQDFATDGSQFDLLLGEGDTLTLGELSIKVLSTPGHTPACVSYQIGDALFIGDTFLAPRYGTARADFPGGDASTLYQSLERILSFPDDTRIYLCHDYPEAGSDPQYLCTVADQRNNIHVQGSGADDFIKLRKERDAALEMPVLILPAIQVNIRAGQLPTPEDNGVAYLKIPLNQIGK
ncbi:MAG: MBL fold metallo-hydrolase [Gammaproteobacteria bacterium]|nr:MBL fold metallo-hydrolase [Gammaproteobacteria bacterium]MBQ0839588.1 MBL fold metallo-hydrolase [Gammaproteobacteria bacterium]